ncbi:MAG: hypothetical protein HY011_26565 [Acidobacteria bacterium]|nr:hypothetical protein [Acidobacteriota bacterium]
MNHPTGKQSVRKTIIQIVNATAMLLALLCGLASAAWAQSNPANFVTIREKAGVTTKQYPIQLGRVFVQGEIPNFPRAVLNGTGLTTQADVKSRWPDGSVKHAVLTFYLPTLSARSSVTITFINQTSGNNTGFMSKREMQASKLNFDALTELTQGGSVSASARDMLDADKFEYWNKGSVSTSIILADHSLARAFDLGFDANRSVRPLFHATFWPDIRKVRIRFIGEVANTIALQDQSYSLKLKLGRTAPQTVYSKANLTQHVASRWTKEFWLGGAPPAIEINHNLAYLKQTRALPNYDTGRLVPEAALSAAYNDPYNGWAAAPKDLFDRGNLTKLMPTAGGRDEIGPYPTWLVLWLFTGDTRMQEKTFGNAELAAAFPVHFREGLNGRNFDRNSSTPALGKVLSLTARPTVFLYAGNDYINYSETVSADKIVPVGTMTNGGWRPDSAHQPDYFSPLYAVTGDYFFLEEMYFWTAWSAAGTNFTDTYFWGRGPAGDTGGIQDEVRGDAWALRTRAQTAWFAPDGTPEKTYFTRLVNDAIGIWEGTLSLTGTPNQNTANWNWGNTVAVKKYYDEQWPNYFPYNPVLPPQRVWDRGPVVFADSTDIDPAKASRRTQPWQIHFMIYSLGRAKELGFATGPLLSWVAPVLTNELTNPAYNPYLAASFMMPTLQKLTPGDQYFSNWADTRSAFVASYAANAQADFVSQLADANHGYPAICMAAAAMAAAEPNGAQAWTFIQQQVVTPAATLNDNPKWAILPR